MVKTLSTLYLGSLLACPIALADEAKLIGVNAHSGLPEGADFSVQPMGYKFGATLHFFVSGENMISFNEDSLKADGWKLGSFPKVSNDGTQASFSITKKGDFIDKLDSIKAAGSVTIFTGTTTETQKHIFEKKGEKAKIGPFTVSIGGKSGGFFSGKGVHIKGKHSTIKKVVVMQDGKELDSNGSSWANDSKTIDFENIKPGAEVSITYWPKLEQKVITFSK